MSNRSLARLAQLLAAVLLLAVPSARAQNTTNGASYGYVVGQGPINVFFGNTVGTDTERWYSVSLTQGKSYCFETFRGNSEYNADVDLTIDLIQVAGGAIVKSFEGIDSDPTVGNNSRWTRGCLVSPATQSYYVRLHKCSCAGSRVGNVQFRVSETTLHAPWWFVSGLSGYDAFVELANTTTVAVSVLTVIKGPGGNTLGSSILSIPAGGNTALSVATGFGTSVTSGSGSVQVSHDGPPGAITGNITTLSAVTGLSFDSPLTPRQGFK